MLLNILLGDWAGYSEPQYPSTDWLRAEFTSYLGSGQKGMEVVYGSGSWTTAEVETAVGYGYDILNRMIWRVVDPNEGGLNLTTDYGYDAAGNRTWMRDPEGNYIHYGFDNANRPVTESFATASDDPNEADIRGRTLYYANGKTAAALSYDYDGTLLARSDFEYDARGRLTEVVEQIDDDQTPDTAVTEYGYSDTGFSVDGQLYQIRITDGEGKQTYIALDAFGGVKTLYPSGDYEEYEYNGDGTVAARAVWDASSVKRWITYDYDPYGRVERVTYPDSGTVHTDYDGFGRRISVEDERNTDDRIGGTGTITWEHDALGRVSKVIDQDNWQVVYTWRADGQRSAILAIDSNDGRTRYHVGYLYDAAGRLEYVAEPLRGITTPWVAKLAYDLNGNRSGLTYYLDGTLNGDTVAVGYGYNDDNFLTSYSTTGGPYHALTRTIDGLGRSVTLAETQTKQNGQSLALNWAYGYDLRSQIRSVTGTIDGVPWAGSYQYYKDGNIDEQTVQGTQTVFGYSGDLLTQRGQQDLGWDGNGQLTTDEVRTLGWTWGGQIRSATNAGGGMFCRYDPDGYRIRKEVQATGQQTQIRKYIVDLEGDVPQVLLEINPAITDPNQAIVRTFLYADTQMVAFHDGHYDDALYFALSDQHGSIRQVMNDDGVVVNGYTYDPWGSPLVGSSYEAVAEPIRYAGYWWDKEIQRYYCWARYYDPLLERFLSRDPERGSFEEPFELHRYLYCLNDPINNSDPTGKSYIAVIGGISISNILRSLETPVKIGVSMYVAYLMLDIIDRADAANAMIDGLYYGIDGLWEMGSVLAADVGLVSMANRTDGWGGKTIGNIIRENRISSNGIEHCPRPPGGPDWKDILKMTWDQIVKAAKEGKQWAKMIKKEMLKPYNWPR